MSRPMQLSPAIRPKFCVSWMPEEAKMSISIPFLDLVTPHRELEDELVEVFRHALQTASFIGGPVLEKFEEDFATYCDTKFAVGVSSGTDALRFAIIGCGIEPGEVVLTVPN